MNRVSVTYKTVFLSVLSAFLICFGLADVAAQYGGTKRSLTEKAYKDSLQGSVKGDRATPVKGDESIAVRVLGDRPPVEPVSDVPTINAAEITEPDDQTRSEAVIEAPPVSDDETVSEIESRRSEIIPAWEVEPAFIPERTDDSDDTTTAQNDKSESDGAVADDASFEPESQTSELTPSRIVPVSELEAAFIPPTDTKASDLEAKHPVDDVDNKIQSDKPVTPESLESAVDIIEAEVEEIAVIDVLAETEIVSVQVIEQDNALAEPAEIDLKAVDERINEPDVVSSEAVQTIESVEENSTTPVSGPEQKGIDATKSDAEAISVGKDIGQQHRQNEAPDQVTVEESLESQSETVVDEVASQEEGEPDVGEGDVGSSDSDGVEEDSRPSFDGAEQEAGSSRPVKMSVKLVTFPRGASQLKLTGSPAHVWEYVKTKLTAANIAILEQNKVDQYFAVACNDV